MIFLAALVAAFSPTRTLCLYFSIAIEVLMQLCSAAAAMD